MARQDEHILEKVEGYDKEAEATGWLGPEVVFGLAYKYIERGQSILDIGIGTGLGVVLFRKAGLQVYGMDVSQEMLDECRRKGFTNLARHDLTNTPYPYGSESLDHIICIGVLHFFRDLSPVFSESARILKKEGLLLLVVGDRAEDEAPEIVLETEHTKSGAPVTLYFHSQSQISRWAYNNGFTLLRSLLFIYYMDHEKKQPIQSRAYLLRKTTGTE